jgi:hypothetical protein
MLLSDKRHNEADSIHHFIERLAGLTETQKFFTADDTDGSDARIPDFKSVISASSAVNLIV